MKFIYLANMIFEDAGEQAVRVFISEKKAKDYVYNRLYEDFNGDIDADDTSMIPIEINDEVGLEYDGTDNIVATFEAAGDVEGLVRRVELVEGIN